ncbi:spermidine/putrescine-binding periplasmic protein PotD [Gottschalkia acidurici 9a]|uniref:Spermidine/putrescine-binding periplasmic protein PotD n=1 Tax=Gottschalkia acidurici (strain ATCC 7906 / DSM 604 / BCRC 14475 / CIP 104303 / KCTC 5404 / NCIMB 10678 / 9a) TaxID=1128398 RepID=K0B022_GOTA9|nr:ABC transporter substrate-binding protein [Gottschalkia acidurici]AFS77971.1 spermidine/putrescine-binding periplasmic protein PotD [Gottschalkia acidurici 9a]
MKRSFKSILAIILVILTGIATVGCGEEKTTLNVYNWGDYIDPEVLKDFEKETGIKVIYDRFDTNEDMYIKVKKGVNYDVLFPSDYMIDKMIKEDLLEKIDFNNVPNYKYIDERFKNLAFDPKNEYSVPYMWGTVGILYNKNMVKEPVDSWDILWDEKYKEQILMLNSQRDSLGVALKKLGYSMNSTNDKELEEAKQELVKQKPLVYSYVGDELKDMMINEEAAMSVVWSGDAGYTMTENSNLAYAIPKEGSNYWFDNIVIPKTVKHKKEAEMFIDFLCRPEVAKRNAEYIGYATPNTEAVKKLPKEVIENKALYPNGEDLNNLEVFIDLDDYVKNYERIWTEVVAE